MDPPGQQLEERLEAQRPRGDGNPFSALLSDDTCCERDARVSKHCGLIGAYDDQLAALDALILAQQHARQGMLDQIALLQDHYLKVSSELQSVRRKRSAGCGAEGSAQELEALRDELSRERHRSRCQSQEAAAAAVALAEARADAQQQRVLADCAVRKLVSLRDRCSELEERSRRAAEPDGAEHGVRKLASEVGRLQGRQQQLQSAGGCESAECAAALCLEQRTVERLALEVKRLQLLLAASDSASARIVSAAPPASAASPASAALPASAASPATAQPAASSAASAVAARRAVKLPLSAPAGRQARVPQQPQRQQVQRSSAAAKNGAPAKRSSAPGTAAASTPRVVSSESPPAPAAAATPEALLEWVAGLPDRFNRQLQALVSPESPSEQVGPALLLDCPVPPPGVDPETAGRQVLDWLVRVWNGRLQRIVVTSLTRRLPHSAGGTVLYYFVQQLLDTGCPLPTRQRTELLRRLDGFPGNGRLRQDVHQVKMRVRPIAITRPVGSSSTAAPTATAAAAPASKRSLTPEGSTEPQQERSAASRAPAASAGSISPRRPPAAASATAPRARTTDLLSASSSVESSRSQQQKTRQRKQQQGDST